MSESSGQYSLWRGKKETLLITIGPMSVYGGLFEKKARGPSPRSDRTKTIYAKYEFGGRSGRAIEWKGFTQKGKLNMHGLEFFCDVGECACTLENMVEPPGEIASLEQIASTLRFAEEKTSPPATNISSTAAHPAIARKGGMWAKDKAQLTKAMASLPDSLKYLRDPILAIADEDQSILGTGGVDAILLAEAVNRRADLLPKGFASAHARELDVWLRCNGISDEAWAAPLWFAMSFLIGFDKFK